MLKKKYLIPFGIFVIVMRAYNSYMILEKNELPFLTISSLDAQETFRNGFLIGSQSLTIILSILIFIGWITKKNRLAYPETSSNKLALVNSLFHDDGGRSKWGLTAQLFYIFSIIAGYILPALINAYQSDWELKKDDENTLPDWSENSEYEIVVSLDTLCNCLLLFIFIWYII